MARAFNGTSPNLNYAVNQLNRRQNVLTNLINAIQGVIGGIQGGNGAVATNQQVENAVQWGINKVTTNRITYSQDNRNLKNLNGLSYDCSSFVITMFFAAGIDVNATTTFDMKQAFIDKGFTWIPGRRFESSQLFRGDILLNETYHTEVYIGNNQDVNCGSTPARIITHNVDYWGTGWDGVLRLVG